MGTFTRESRYPGYTPHPGLCVDHLDGSQPYCLRFVDVAPSGPHRSWNSIRSPTTSLRCRRSWYTDVPRTHGCFLAYVSPGWFSFTVPFAFSGGESGSLRKTSDTAVAVPGHHRETAIEARSLSKSYKLYRSKGEKVADALGLGQLAFWREPPPQFLALDNVNLQIRKGEKVGVIGRNGAGKSTLLKLISGVLHPSQGDLDVVGSVQVLMYVGLGFHPEFTGRENIRASLLYNGLTPEARKAAEADIIRFAELQDFLDQPLRTYSLGMRSRLQFACATLIATGHSGH